MKWFLSLSLVHKIGVFSLIFLAAVITYLFSINPRDMFIASMFFGSLAALGFGFNFLADQPWKNKRSR
jgi:hypothetical protein